MPAPSGDQVDGEPVAPTSGRPGYFGTRFTGSNQRGVVWHHMSQYLRRWIPVDADVLKLAAGWCVFANAVTARSVTAMDTDEMVTRAAKPGVRAVVGNCTDSSRYADGSFDRVVASNLLEHLQRPMTLKLLAEATQVLRPGGRLVLILPTFRLYPNEYLDDHTDVAIDTDRSLRNLLNASGWDVQHVAARFLPLSMKSRGAGLTFLVPLCLRFPVKPFAGQMLVVAGRPVPSR